MKESTRIAQDAINKALSRRPTPSVTREGYAAQVAALEVPEVTICPPADKPPAKPYKAKPSVQAQAFAQELERLQNNL